jgi:hypothetical protein
MTPLYRNTLYRIERLTDGRWRRASSLFGTKERAQEQLHDVAKHDHGQYRLIEVTVTHAVSE